MAASTAVCVTSRSLSLRYRISFGMAASKGVSPGACLLSIPHDSVSLHISYPSSYCSHCDQGCHMLFRQLLMCWENVYMCFRASWNQMVQDLCSPCTTPCNLCLLQLSHMNWLSTHVFTNWVFMGKLIVHSCANTAICPGYQGPPLMQGHICCTPRSQVFLKLLSSHWS